MHDPCVLRHLLHAWRFVILNIHEAPPNRTRANKSVLVLSHAQLTRLASAIKQLSSGNCGANQHTEKTGVLVAIIFLYMILNILITIIIIIFIFKIIFTIFIYVIPTIIFIFIFIIIFIIIIIIPIISSTLTVKYGKWKKQSAEN